MALNNLSARNKSILFPENILLFILNKKESLQIKEICLQEFSRSLCKQFVRNKKNTSKKKFIMECKKYVDNNYKILKEQNKQEKNKKEGEWLLFIRTYYSQKKNWLL